MVPAVSPGAPPSSGGGGDADHIVDAAAATVGGEGDTYGSGLAIGGLESTVLDTVVRLDLATWSVPAAAVGVPGALLVLVVLFQLLGGTAWVPVARRSLAGVGVRKKQRPAARGTP